MNTTPQLNQPLPEYCLSAAVPGADGAITETTITNADLRGRPFVLFFYPKDATCGCIVEVCGFRDLYSEFEKLGVAVLGVSRDTMRSHIRFIQNQNVPYPLLCDTDRNLSRAWGLLVNKTMYGKPVTGTARTTFVVDGNGIVRRVFEKVTPLGHAQAVLDCVRDL